MPSQKKRPVTLTAQDLEDVVRVMTMGVQGASQIMRARVQLALDTSVGEVDAQQVVAARPGVLSGTVGRVAKRFARRPARTRAPQSPVSSTTSAGPFAGDR